jgi:hypothetical protein
MEVNDPGAGPEASRRRTDRDPPRRETSRRPEVGADRGGRAGRDADPLEQRLDRWVNAGRQLVDGVSGARPGSRGGERAERRGGPRAGFDGLGRWVEGKLDWLLEDGDDWREPWQEPQAAADQRAPAQRASVTDLPAGGPPAAPRRRLEAVSRRGAREAEPAAAPAEDEWPDDDTFNLSRWQRGPRPEAPPSPPPPSGGRPLPRSSRRRQARLP